MKGTLTIKNDLGLHARAAAKFVDITNKFKSDIIVKLGDRTFDGKSIMGLLSIGVKKGDSVEVIITGIDEDEAFKALEKLINIDLLNL